jgi:hypothetical protein
MPSRFSKSVRFGMAPAALIGYHNEEATSREYLTASRSIRIGEALFSGE